MSSELVQIIERLIEEKTFSVEGVKAVEALREKAVSLEVALERTRNTLDDRNAELIRLRSEAATKDQLLMEWGARERSLVAREKDADKAIYDSEKHQAVANVWQQAMSMVFKPAAIRTEIQRQVAVPVEGHPGGHGYSPTGGFVTTHPETETTTTSQE